MRAFTVLINPVSGGGKAAQKWAPVAARLAAADADVRVETTRSREHATECARSAVDEQRVAVAVGGDGFVRDVAEGAVAAGGTIAIVPGGRGNDFARRLGLPSDPAGLAELLLHGRPRPLDVIEVNGAIVPGNVYCGVDSIANALINANRRLPAKLVYRVAPVRAVLSWRPATFTLTLDGAARTLRGHSIVVANSGGYGHGLDIVPSAVPDDGELDVLLVADGPRSAVVSFMRAAQRGTHVDRPEVSVVRARTVTLDADRPLPVCGDGEELTTLPTTMRIRTAALPVLAPPG